MAENSLPSGQRSVPIHFTRLLDYLKSSDIFCPRKVFWAKIPLPKKALQKISLDFCLKNPSCYRALRFPQAKDPCGIFLIPQGHDFFSLWDLVCERHLECRVVGICDDIFIIASLSKALSCAAEMKKILKEDLDMDLNVPKFNVFFPDTSFSLDTARSALDSAVRADPALACDASTTLYALSEYS